MSILIDYSQMVIAPCYVFESDMQKGGDSSQIHDILRHVSLKSILAYKRDYGQTYGDIIICCDGKRSWRKDVYQYYKAHRAKGKEESTLDWESIFEFMDQFRSDLEENFPYPVIYHEKAEGDDVIGAITMYHQDNDLDTEGNALFGGSPKPTLIISSDGDFNQFLHLENVRQYNPRQRKFFEKPSSSFLIEKIIRGDGGDGVPSVLMQDDFLVNKTGRATSVTEKVIEKFKNYDQLNKEEKRRFDRNKQMIDISCMPDYLRKELVELYTTTKPTRDMSKIMKYLVANRCREHLTNIHQF